MNELIDEDEAVWDEDDDYDPDDFTPSLYRTNTWLNFPTQTSLAEREGVYAL